ncbi:Hypothetical protein LUCI_0349 [Lucifera butyrica]|uniref:4Fe-4S ferredoxin-type domain-containing protein n=1 Tax=Lucifera butyrica TaxID=1351585 RepID=A0A498R4E1_9FIRM|nr:epoxyqueuosine reductase [Lucifera butyrica]VBB05142.1 Hypothetical protein LUCI_0349 [Lucifera butyrica]
MKQVNAAEIKRRIRELGADLCGIAPVERFADAPAGFHPNEVLIGCQSVIVFAARFPATTLSASSPAAYTFVRNRLVDKVDAISFQIAVELEDLSGKAIPVPSSGPYDYWDSDRRHGQGILSLKHAAVRAGLGQMGKNTLLINDRWGNLIWLSAVLTNAGLEPDPVASYQACAPDCRLCLDACPAGALDGKTIEQRKCRSICGKSTEGGGFVYACNVCRKVCPQYRGFSQPQLNRI